MERGGVFEAVAKTFRHGGGTVVEPRMATREELQRIHTPGYLDTIESFAGRGVMLDEDTFMSPETYDVARLAAGATIDAARHAWTSGEAAMALVRPPGHHAEAHKAMGFCLYSNIAIAAAALRADGVERVAIVDFDVHHGNGTQAAFTRSRCCLFIHQSLWPVRSAPSGHVPGLGATLMCRWHPARPQRRTRRVRTSGGPALEGFRPQVLLSRGYDAPSFTPSAS